MANADEAVGQDVQQEPPEELVGGEGQDLAVAAGGVVPPTKADHARVETDQPAIGQRDAVGVAPEVGQHLRGAGEGRIRIDDPVVALLLGTASRDVEFR